MPTSEERSANVRVEVAARQRLPLAALDRGHRQHSSSAFRPAQAREAGIRSRGRVGARPCGWPASLILSSRVAGAPGAGGPSPPSLWVREGRCGQRDVPGRLQLERRADHASARRDGVHAAARERRPAGLSPLRGRRCVSVVSPALLPPSCVTPPASPTSPPAPSSSRSSLRPSPTRTSSTTTRPPRGSALRCPAHSSTTSWPPPGRRSSGGHEEAGRGGAAGEGGQEPA